MGKWAQYMKRGSAALAGILPAPVVGDFTMGTPTTSSVPVTRNTAPPTPATTVYWAALNSITGAVANTGSSASASFSVTGLSSGSTYNLIFSWGNAVNRLSDWGPKYFVTVA